MRFSELVKLLEKNGFQLLKEKGSIRYYASRGMTNWFELIFTGRRKYQQEHVMLFLRQPGLRTGVEAMIDLKYSLIIEATSDPSFFGFYSPDLEGFTGVGHSIEDCLYKAKWGMEEHLILLADQKMPIPDPNPNPTVVVQNEAELAPAA
jgi:predicted RNase H-like HicB family nuclease/predicted RNA binding protein YcfA (HicA-like mRNA interferase family)